LRVGGRLLREQLGDLVKFYQTLVETVDFMEEERKKLKLLEEYNRDNKPIGRSFYQPIYEAEKEQEKCRALEIPYIGYLTTFHNPIPDYSEVRYVPKTLRPFPIS